ncbi:MAG: TonB-dependent receptor [Pseudobdellovibrio sp.]
MLKISFICFVLFSLKIFANDFETIVTDRRFNSSSTVIIDQKEIQKSRAKNLTTLLATQANISIAQSNFQPSSIYLRGGDSSHVLILVDGIPYYDAASVQRTINLNSIDLKSIRRIEVIKGSQTVLFGGQALSGVIKIDTIPNELTTSSQVTGQIGTQQYHAASAGGIIALGDHHAIVIRTSAFEKDSVSPITSSSKNYPTRLSTAELGYVYRSAGMDAVAKVQTSFDKTFIPTTAFPSYLPADTNNFETSSYQLGFQGLIKLKETSLMPTLIVGSQKTVRLYEQDAISGSGTVTKQDYTGELIATRFEITPVSTESFKLLAGLNSTQEKLVYKDLDVLKSDESSSFEGAFVKGDLVLSANVHLELGDRVDFNKLKNANSTSQIGLVMFENYKIEYATGIKQPSLFQLFSSYGNQNLQPEKASTISVLLEHRITPEIFTSITLFGSEFSNLIITSGTPLRYENISKSKTVGAEMALGCRVPDQKLSFNLNLGYQEPRDTDADNWLVRRPLRTASFKTRKEFEKTGFGVELVHNGDRRDRQGSTSYGTLPAYTYINSTFDFTPKENLTLFVRGQNLSNQRYESSYGFFDEGISVATGFEATFF